MLFALGVIDGLAGKHSGHGVREGPQSHAHVSAEQNKAPKRTKVGKSEGDIRMRAFSSAIG